MEEGKRLEAIDTKPRPHANESSHIQRYRHQTLRSCLHAARRFIQIFFQSEIQILISSHKLIVDIRMLVNAFLLLVQIRHS